MLAKRLIPCLDVDRGRVVKGVQFVSLRDAGDPVECAARYDAEGADELVFLDITASSDARPIVLDMVRRVADTVFLPFTVGGGVRTVEDADALLRAGADKVGGQHRGGRSTRRSSTELSRRFGSQAVVLAIDARSQGGGTMGGLRPRRPHAHGARRGGLGARGGGARRGRDPAHEHGPRRDEGRLRPAPHPRGGRRRQRARGGLGRLRTVAHMAEVLTEGRAERGARRLDLPLRRGPHSRGEGPAARGGRRGACRDPVPEASPTTRAGSCPSWCRTARAATCSWWPGPTRRRSSGPRRPSYAHFWSRSRKALWRKGETSGNGLRVRRGPRGLRPRHAAPGRGARRAPPATPARAPASETAATSAPGCSRSCARDVVAARPDAPEGSYTARLLARGPTPSSRRSGRRPPRSSWPPRARATSAWPRRRPTSCSTSRSLALRAVARACGAPARRGVPANAPSTPAEGRVGSREAAERAGIRGVRAAVRGGRAGARLPRDPGRPAARPSPPSSPWPRARSAPSCWRASWAASASRATRSSAATPWPRWRCAEGVVVTDAGEDAPGVARPPRRRCARASARPRPRSPACRASRAAPSAISTYDAVRLFERIPDRHAPSRRAARLLLVLPLARRLRPRGPAPRAHRRRRAREPRRLRARPGDAGRAGGRPAAAAVGRRRAPAAEAPRRT